MHDVMCDTVDIFLNYDTGK